MVKLVILSLFSFLFSLLKASCAGIDDDILVSALELVHSSNLNLMMSILSAHLSYMLNLSRVGSDHTNFSSPKLADCKACRTFSTTNASS